MKINIPVEIDDSIIEKTNTVKYLGILIHDDLKL